MIIYNGHTSEIIHTAIQCLQVKKQNDDNSIAREKN